MGSGLEWAPYLEGRGQRVRVRDFMVRGGTEYELCSEGGQAVIRRIVRRNGRIKVSEAARGRPAEALVAWQDLIRDTASVEPDSSV